MNISQALKQQGGFGFVERIREARSQIRIRNRKSWLQQGTHICSAGKFLRNWP